MNKKNLLIGLGACVILLSGCAKTNINPNVTEKESLHSGQCATGLRWDETIKICVPDQTIMIKNQLTQLESKNYAVLSGKKQATFEDKDIRFNYQKSSSEKNILIHKAIPINGIYHISGGRAIIEFVTITPNMNLEEFLKTRYMMGISTGDQSLCSIVSSEISKDLIETKIIPSDDGFKKYANDISSLHRLCGPYSAVNNILFLHKKDDQKKVIIVEKNPRTNINIESITIK